MPVGNYPIYKDKKQTIKHPASGLSKNKYDAKGNLRPQRKSRAKAEQPEGTITDRETGEVRQRIRAERADKGITQGKQGVAKMLKAKAEVMSNVTTKLGPISYQTEIGYSLADDNKDMDSDGFGIDDERGKFETYDGGRYREDPDERLQLLPDNVPKAHLPNEGNDPYPHIFGTYTDSDKDAEHISGIGGFYDIEGGEGDIYNKQRILGDAFIKKMAFDNGGNPMLQRHPTFNIAFADNDTPYFFDPNKEVLPSKMKWSVKMKDGRKLTAFQAKQEGEFMKTVKEGYIPAHAVDNTFGESDEYNNQKRIIRRKHWGEEYGRGQYREKFDMKKDNLDSEGRPRFLYKGGQDATFNKGKYRSKYKFIHYGDVPPASVDAPFLGMNKQDIVDIDGNPLYAEVNNFGLKFGGNTKYIKLQDTATHFDTANPQHQWRKQGATSEFNSKSWVVT